MAKQKFDYDLVVIGSGASGSVAADIVASAKWRVAMVEDDELGGETANWSSIPSKALLRAAEVFDEAKMQGPALGLRSGAIGYNYPSVRAYKDAVLKKSGAKSYESYYKGKGITILKGHAHFINPHEITLDRRHISAAHFLVASGSVPSNGKVQGLDKVPYLTPRTALDVIRPPKTLFIIGAGASGCEFASLFSAFGSKVYIADEAARILPKEDQEVSEAVQHAFHYQRGISLLTHAKVIRVAKAGLMTAVTYLVGSEEHTVRVDQILLAAGQEPMVDIGLENAGVEHTKNGIKTDEYLTTSKKHIYAAGNVLGRFMYTHTGVYEGRVVANNLLHPKQLLSPDYTAVPRVTFVTPEVASVGLSESDCLRRDLPIRTATAPLNIIARATIDNVTNGFVKVIADKRGVLLGASIVAPHAGETIHELTLAVQHGLTAAEVATTLHAFPTWSEAVRVACAKIK